MSEWSPTMVVFLAALMTALATGIGALPFLFIRTISGGTAALAKGSTLHFYGGAALVHEFAGDDGATLESGGTSEHVDNERIGTFGQGTAGLNLLTPGGLTGFIEGNANFGGGYTGFGGRIGLGIKL